MKHFSALLFFVSACCATAGTIEVAELDPDSPLLVEVGSGSTTTLQFPEPVSTVIGAGLSKTGEGGSFLYAIEPGSNLLTLRSLKPDAHLVVTVEMAGELYVFMLRSSSTPAVVVRLKKQADSKKAREVTKEQVIASRLVDHERKYRELVNLARNHDLLSGQLAEKFQDVQIRESGSAWRSSSISTKIDRIVRFPGDDALVFIGTIENIGTSQSEIPTWAVRIGGREFSLNYISARKFGAHERVAFAAVLMGDGGGKKSHISLRNEFQIVIPNTEGRKKR